MESLRSTITLVSDTITLVGELGHNIPSTLFCFFFVVVADYLRNAT